MNGKVEVGNGLTTTIISPGQQAITTSGNARIEVKEVDTNVVTAWVRDMFYFDEKPLGEIMQELSRWYEFKVIFEKESLKQRKFTIETSRYEDIDKVLKLIEETHVVTCR
ncbi:MAG: FecR family protein [Butyricimonas paravirosa]